MLALFAKESVGVYVETLKEKNLKDVSAMEEGNKILKKNSYHRSVDLEFDELEEALMETLFNVPFKLHKDLLKK
ncbi:hypothetical protein LXL04_020692 [Taraxacum kok-saghyz]